MNHFFKRRLDAVKKQWTDFRNFMAEDWQHFHSIHRKVMKKILLYIGILFATQFFFRLIAILTNQDMTPTEVQQQKLFFTGGITLVFLSMYLAVTCKQKPSFFFFRVFETVLMITGGYITAAMFIQHFGEVQTPRQNMLFSLKNGQMLACLLIGIRCIIIRRTFLMIYIAFYLIGSRGHYSDNVFSWLEFVPFSICTFILIELEHYRSEQMIRTLKTRLENEKDYKLLLDALPESIVIVDDELNILHSNHSYQEMVSKDENYRSTKFHSNMFEDLKPRHINSVTISEEVDVSKVPTPTPHHIHQPPKEYKPELNEEVDSYKKLPSNPTLDILITQMLQNFDKIHVDINRTQDNDDGGLMRPNFMCFDATVQEETLETQNTMAKIKKRRCVEIKICPAHFQDHKSVMIVIHDVSQLKENIELKEQNKYKTLLLGSVSHEIRSPLNAAIALLSCAMKDVKVSDYVKSMYISLGLINSKLLLHIVNDILDYTQIDLNKIRIVQTEFNLLDRMNELIQLLSFQAKAKNVALQLDYRLNAMSRVRTDPNRLSQIIINLMNNAMKFTDKGSITLRVKLNEHTGSVIFEVQDTGFGIKDVDQKKLFDIFTKIDLGDKIVNNLNGAGLGLKLCQTLLDLLGSGGLQVHSVYGQGSTFSFELPCEVSNTPKHSEDEENHNLPKCSSIKNHLIPQSTAAPNVWIIDDNPFNVLALEMQLKAYNFNIQKFYDPLQALAAFETTISNPSATNRIGLVLLDLQLPKLSGREVLNCMRKLQLSKSYNWEIPVVACSGHTGDGHIRSALRDGFIDYLPKPVQPEKIEAIITKCIRLH